MLFPESLSPEILIIKKIRDCLLLIEQVSLESCSSCHRVAEAVFLRTDTH